MAAAITVFSPLLTNKSVPPIIKSLGLKKHNTDNDTKKDKSSLSKVELLKIEFEKKIISKI